MSNLKGAFMKRFFRSNENVSEEQQERKEKTKSVHGFAAFGQKVKTTWESRSLYRKPFTRQASVEDTTTVPSQEQSVNGKKKMGSRSLSLTNLPKKSLVHVDLTAINEAYFSEARRGEFTTDGSEVEEMTEKSTEEMTMPFEEFYNYSNNNKNKFKRRNVVMGVRAAQQQYTKKDTLIETNRTTHNDDSNKENQRLVSHSRTVSEPTQYPTEYQSVLTTCMEAFEFLDDMEINQLNKGAITNETAKNYPFRPPVPTPRKSLQRKLTTILEKPTPKPRTLPFRWRSKPNFSQKLI